GRRTSTPHRQGGWGGRIRTSEYGIQSPAPCHLATPQERSQNHFTARLVGGTASARTPKTISPLASPEAPAPLARQKPFHRSRRRRHRLRSHYLATIRIAGPVRLRTAQQSQAPRVS